MTTPVEAARKYLKVKFHHQGRSREYGLDCLGLVIVVAQDLGFDPVDQIDYAQRPDTVNLMKSVREQLIEIPLQEAAPNDLLLFAFHKRGPQHFAFLTPDDTIIQALVHVGVVEVSYDEPWRKRATHAFRFPETWQQSH